MTRDYFMRLYDYTFWAERKLWNGVMQLSEAQFRQDLGYSHGSIRDQCIHIMATEHMYFTLLKNGQAEILNGAGFPDRASIRRQWDETGALIRAYLADLTPDEMERMVRWQDRPPIYVWEALTQVVAHGIDHRAQTLAGLHRLGAPTMPQDFIYHALETRA